MFTEFSAKLYDLLSHEEYKMGDSREENAHWIMQKVEMATLINLHVIDFTKTSWDEILVNHKINKPRMESLRGKLGQVANVYVIFGGEAPDFANAEEYDGQAVYSVFWHVNEETGEILAPKSHPRKLFGIEKTINKALLQDREVLNSFGKKLPPLQPKYKYPILTLAIIGANAIVLALMYLNGYPQDFWVPRTFGAIYPPWIFEYGQWWRLFTAMFVHFGVAHFAANIFGLIIFGTRVERYFGRLTFSVIYLAAGLLGSVFSLFISAGYAAGASGAVYALVGAVLAFTRITRRSVEFLNWYLMFVYIGVGIAIGFATPGVDNAAHIGGLIGGFIIGAVYAKLRK